MSGLLISAAEDNANTALSSRQSILVTSNSVLTQTTSLRNQLTPPANDAADGLAFAEEAFMAVEEEQLVRYSLDRIL